MCWGRKTAKPTAALDCTVRCTGCYKNHVDSFVLLLLTVIAVLNYHYYLVVFSNVEFLVSVEHCSLCLKVVSSLHS